MRKRKKIEASIIIRTKNESRWLNYCIDSIFSQTFQNFEIIIVDNNSTDSTLKIAKTYGLKITKIKKYLPGKALNLGIKKSKGKYIVCISAHCIPKNKYWLSKLLKSLKQKNVAGVYGRQEPLSFSSDSDKRDMAIAFGLDKIIQKKDSFFHNANSAIKRSLWNKIKFDEKITNIEDRIWANNFLKLGYKIIYEPAASVYHYHGIHQNGNPVRLRQVVEILEQNKLITSKNIKPNKNIKTYAIIPIMGPLPKLKISSNPLEITFNSIKQNKYISKIILASDNVENLRLGKKLGIDILIKRPLSLSKKFVTIEDILRYVLKIFLKQDNEVPGIVIYSSVNDLFRKKNLFDKLRKHLISGNFTKVLPSVVYYHSIWKKNRNSLERIDFGSIPTNFKRGINIGLAGLGTAFDVESLMNDESEKKVGLIEVSNFSSLIDLNTQDGIDLTNNSIEKWLEKNK